MYDCIFTPHCIERMCDRSCPILAETTYLLERNGLSAKSSVFRKAPEGLNEDKVEKLLSKSEDSCASYVTLDTVAASDYITYCAICNQWRGSQLHCNVYNLKYSSYINLTKQSWSTKQDPEELEYMRIWIENAKVLIISGIDFVNFNDFECQTFLSLLQSRRSRGRHTIIVSPPVKNLVGKSSFFSRVISAISESRGGDDKK